MNSYTELMNSLVGLNQEEANAVLAKKEMYTRIVRIDDMWMGVTDDLIPERVDIELESGLIVKAG